MSKEVFYVRFNTGNRWAYGARWFETIEEAQNYCKDKNYIGIQSITKNDSFVKDGPGFRPHYNHGLGKYISSRSEYKQELKANNLIELGNEKPDYDKYNKALAESNKNDLMSKEAIDYIRGTGNSIEEAQVREINKIGTESV